MDPRTGEWLEHPVRTAFDATFNDMIEDFQLRLLQMRMAAAIGIDFTRANVLEVESGPNCGQLTGRMVDQPWGDICDGAEKRRTLLEVASLLDIEPAQCIAMGDGANDLPMMGVAGLSVAYHAKPAVRAQAQVAINEGGLDRLLEVLAD